MRQDLISRNYNPKIIEQAFQKVKKVERIKALERVERVKEKKTPLVTKFHPNLPSLSKIIRKHWGVMVNHDPRLQRIFPKPSVVAYRRGKNLRDLLVRAKLSSRRKSTRKSNGYSRCGRGVFKMCPCCSLIPEKGYKTHKCNKTGEIFKINNNVNCVTDNVIYRIAYKKCEDFLICVPKKI